MTSPAPQHAPRPRRRAPLPSSLARAGASGLRSVARGSAVLGCAVLSGAVLCGAVAGTRVGRARADVAPPRWDDWMASRRPLQPVLRSATLTVRSGERPGLRLRLENPRTAPVTLEVVSLSWVDKGGSVTALRVTSASLGGQARPPSAVAAPPRSSLPLVLGYEGLTDGLLGAGGRFRIVARLAGASVVVDVPVVVRPPPPPPPRRDRPSPERPPPLPGGGALSRGEGGSLRLG
jgi:hypothetical protein